MPFLKKIFPKNKLASPVDLSVLHTDMHSHLIPGIDDGAESIEESLLLIKKLSSLGYKKLIITPHVIGDCYKNSAETITENFEKLRTAVIKEGINIELGVAAEYLIDDGFENFYKTGKLLTFGGKYILIELPFINTPGSLLTIIFELQINGYKVILAHPERYSYWYDDFAKIEDLKNREVFFQMNIISLSGFYSLPTKKMAGRLIENNMIEFLGTDMHRNEYMESLEKSLYEKPLEKLISSGKLLNSTL